MLVASKGSGFDSIESFQDADGKITYGTTGVGTGAQLACALTFNVNKTPAEAIPFDGGAPALTALLGDQVDTACLQVGEAIENIESGKIVPITVFGPERVEFLPDVPTAQEQGLDVEVAQYRFMTVPKGTPQDVQDSIAEAMQATFETSEYQDFNEQNNLTPMEISGDEVVAQLEEDKQRYADLVEEYGIDLARADRRTEPPSLTARRRAHMSETQPRPAPGATHAPRAGRHPRRDQGRGRPGPRRRAAARGRAGVPGGLGAVVLLIGLAGAGSPTATASGRSDVPGPGCGRSSSRA